MDRLVYTFPKLIILYKYNGCVQNVSQQYKLVFCLGWKRQFICWEGRGGREGREGGRGGKEGGGEREGGEGGRVGERGREGREGREGGEGGREGGRVGEREGVQ